MHRAKIQAVGRACMKSGRLPAAGFKDSVAYMHNFPLMKEKIAESEMHHAGDEMVPGWFV